MPSAGRIPLIRARQPPRLPAVLADGYSNASTVPRERVKREHRALRLDLSGPGASRWLPPQLSAASRRSFRPFRYSMGRVTEPSGLGRQGWSRSVPGKLLPEHGAVSQETCRRRANHAAGRGARGRRGRMSVGFSGVSRTMGGVRLRTKDLIHLTQLPPSQTDACAGTAMRGQMGDTQCS